MALHEALDDFCQNLQAHSVALRHLDPVTKREARDTKESQLILRQVLTIRSLAQSMGDVKKSSS